MPPNYFEIKVFSSVCQGINHLHMDGRYCDLSVTVGKSSFSCHRLVLASVSEYFRDVLPDENEAGMICIQDERVPEEIFALILDAVYKGTNIVKDIPTAKTLVRAAVFLKIRILIELCEEFLRDNIDTKNFLDLWQFGDKYDLTVLMEGAAQKVGSRFNAFRETELFLQLPKQFLFAILSSDSLRSSSDEDVCKALLTWVEYDAKHRSCHLPEILPFIRFCSFSEKYIWKLKYNVALFEYIQEAMQVKYETSEKINSLKMTKILSRQERITAADNIKRVTILLDRTTKTGIQIVKLDMSPNKDRPVEALDIFNCHPVDCGPGFASCVWRNELYVSGGSEKPKFFAVYNSGIDKWKTLPDLPNGRERHAMAVVNWNIYVLGGLEESPDGEKMPAARVMTFNLRSKTWSVTANLCKAVQQVGVAVLGQKIYVFGGRDADDNIISLVQCYDTLTGCVYHAGQLPSPTSGVCPLVSAGIVYLVRSEGGVLQMRERPTDEDEDLEEQSVIQESGLLETGEHLSSSEQTDEDEDLEEQSVIQESGLLETGEHLSSSEQTDEDEDLEEQSVIQESGLLETGEHLSSSDQTETGLVIGKYLEQAEVQTQNTFSLQRNIKEDKISSSTFADNTRFIHIANVSKRRYFSAILQGGKIQIYGGQNEAGTFLHDVEEVDLKTREVTIRAGILPRPMSHFGVHLLNVPTPTKMFEFTFSFRPDIWLINEKAFITSPVVIFNKVSWVLQCGYEYWSTLKHTLYIQKPNGKRVVCDNIPYTVMILPAKGQVVLPLSLVGDTTRRMSTKELNDPDKGYIKDGKMTLHVTIFDSNCS